MKPLLSSKSVALLFGAVLVMYLAAFYGCEYVRARKGPWEVQFSSDGAGRPSLVVYQPKTGISSFEILLHGERIATTNLSARVAFDRPEKPVPFGRVLYEDLTFLPGVVTLDMFGHEIELLPRVLIVNKKEYPWKSDFTLEVSPTNKLATPPQPPKKR